MKALINLGYSMTNNGFLYILDAVELMDMDECYTISPMKMYGEIAEKRHTTSERVRTSLKYAFEWIFTKGNLEYVTKYFGSSKLSCAKALVQLYRYLKENEV